MTKLVCVGKHGLIPAPSHSGHENFLLHFSTYYEAMVQSTDMILC